MTARPPALSHDAPDDPARGFEEGGATYLEQLEHDLPSRAMPDFSDDTRLAATPTTARTPMQTSRGRTS